MSLAIIFTSGDRTILIIDSFLSVFTVIMVIDLMVWKKDK